ncbi:hypothetical protein BD289DRAFT_28425 [Coniella lustricola]|uniref:Uncharacterized protein n=1 Tax=Coniella lustricola TaxID=2025994 RepID=A0A2T3AIZ9_9PEZI|nr:hypothetical protein BD289DRAFT_28425 [Coniella lustricola]
MVPPRYPKRESAGSVPFILFPGPYARLSQWQPAPSSGSRQRESEQRGPRMQAERLVRDGADGFEVLNVRQRSCSFQRVVWTPLRQPAHCPCGRIPVSCSTSKTAAGDSGRTIPSNVSSGYISCSRYPALFRSRSAVSPQRYIAFNPSNCGRAGR